MADLIKKTGGSNEAIAELLGDARAIRGAFVLAKNAGQQFNDELALMKNAAGATDTALSYQEQGLNYQLQIFQNKVDAIAVAIGEALIPSVNFLLESLTNMGAGMDRVIEKSVNPFLDELGETAKLLGIDFSGGIDQESFWDMFFKPIRDNFDNATKVLKAFNFAYKEMLRLTGQPIPGEGIKGLDPMSDKYGFRNLETTAPSLTGGTTTVTTTVNIGTDKVDKVVTDAIRRTGHGSGRQ
jgi:hypothetical protein